jgi:hypothetical protein
VPLRRTSCGIGRQGMRVCAAPASHVASYLRSTAGHQPATTPRPVHRSALACPVLLVSHLSMPQSRCSKGDGTHPAWARGCAHVASPCALDMGDYGYSWAGACHAALSVGAPRLARRPYRARRGVEQRRSPGSTRHPGARVRPRAVAHNVMDHGSRRSARRRAHHAVGGRGIPAYTPVARYTSSEHGRPWRDHRTPPPGRAHRQRSGRPCQRSSPQRPAEQDARPRGAPRVPEFPAHASGTSTTRVPLLARSAPPCGAPSPRKRLPDITIRCRGQPHVCSQAHPEGAVGMRPPGQARRPLWPPSGHCAASALNGGQAPEFPAGLLPDSPSRAPAHRWSHPGLGWACLPGPFSAKTRGTCRRRSVGRPAPMARE